jgi:hypothetical protein
MNDRRGPQRIYAVLAVAWAAVLFFLILFDSWQPWYSPILKG